MRVLMNFGHKDFALSSVLLGMHSSNKHYVMPKWGIFNASVLLNEHGHPLFISKLNFSYDNISVNKVRTKIYCHFSGITITSKEVKLSKRVQEILNDRLSFFSFSL